MSGFLYCMLDKKRAYIKERVREVLKAVGLAGYEDQLPKNLSGGQQQRVSIARAIVTKPKFLIADEPTGALDSETSKEIMALFKQLNHDNETTIIIVTHDPNVGAQADRLVHILDGRLTEDVDHKPKGDANEVHWIIKDSVAIVKSQPQA